MGLYGAGPGSRAGDLFCWRAASLDAPFAAPLVGLLAAAAPAVVAVPRDLSSLCLCVLDMQEPIVSIVLRVALYSCVVVAVAIVLDE